MSINISSNELPIFKTFAPKFAALGLTVFPVGGSDGKKPKVKHWEKFGPKSHERYLDKFATDNIGLLDGKEITRIDIDDPNLIDGAIERFGDTPVIVETPRGGCHLWYRSSDEKRQIAFEAKKMDILGWGGYGVAPPSKHPQNGRYTFARGGLSDLASLPLIKEALLKKWDKFNTKPSNIIHEGQRNNQLFSSCVKLAWTVDNQEELIEAAHQLNQSMMSSQLPDGEVLKVVNSVWNYKKLGRLCKHGQSMVVFSGDELELPPHELWGLVQLKKAHGWRNGKPFALANATAVSWKWSLVRFRRFKIKLEGKYIRCVHKGGSGKGDPPLYILL
jgi:hypothetical protein